MNTYARMAALGISKNMLSTDDVCKKIVEYVTKIDENAVKKAIENVEESSEDDPYDDAIRHINSVWNGGGVSGIDIQNVKRLLKKWRTGRRIDNGWDNEISTLTKDYSLWFAELRKTRLEKGDIQPHKLQIIGIFNDFMSVRGMGLTATAKTLHLILPLLFPIWDSIVGNEIGEIKNGRDYFNFMLGVKNALTALDKEAESNPKVKNIINTINGHASKYKDNNIYPEPLRLKILDAIIWGNEKKKNKSK